MTHNEEIDDQPLHAVTKEQLAERLNQIFSRGGVRHDSGNFHDALEIYTFLYSINPERAESWARSYRRLSGYRD